MSSRYIHSPRFSYLVKLTNGRASSGSLRRLVSRHREAYDYLPASVEAFPAGENFVALLREAGFPRAHGVRLMVGAVYLYLATRD